MPCLSTVTVVVIIGIITIKSTSLRVGLRLTIRGCVHCKVWYAAHYAEHMQVSLLSLEDGKQGM